MRVAVFDCDGFHKKFWSPVVKFTTPLIEGKLIMSYKRFLSDIELPNGDVVVAHCPNTGSMKRCQQDGARVWLSKSDNPKRKLAYTWELVEVDAQYLACINTGYPNKLVGEAISNGVVKELAEYPEQKAEVKYGEKAALIGCSQAMMVVSAMWK